MYSKLVLHYNYTPLIKIYNLVKHTLTHLNWHDTSNKL